MVKNRIIVLAETHYNSGKRYHANHDYPKAIFNYLKAINLNSLNPEYYNILAAAYEDSCQYEQAIQNYEKAIELNPENGFYYNNLGLALHKAGKLNQSINSYLQAIKFSPGNAGFYNNLGLILVKTGENYKGIEQFLYAIKLAPGESSAYNNLAIELEEQGKYEEAIKCYSVAVKLNPEKIKYHINLSFAYLRTGDYINGWQEFEFANIVTEKKNKYLENIPKWDGSDLNGKRIYVYSEQGFGDSIQFVRFLPLLKQLNTQVVFGCHPELKSIFEKCEGFDLITEHSFTHFPIDLISNEPLHFDYYIPLLSLPRIFKIRPGNFSPKIPYINIKTSKKSLNNFLVDKKNLKIGIVWESGSPNPTFYKRSCPLKYFQQIGKEINNIQLFSIQKSTNEKQNNYDYFLKGSGIINLGGEINNFYDTAEIINFLDLIISVDTSVVHLAGALGKEVWTILPFSCDWRWGIEKDLSEWYPSMKLFRQSSPGDWQSVFDKIKLNLKIIIKEKYS